MFYITKKGMVNDFASMLEKVNLSEIK